MDTQLVLDALNQALDARGRPSGVIHHSDKGSQYLSIKYGERLKQSGLAASVGMTGDSTKGWARSGCRKYLLLFINSVRLCCLTQVNPSPIKPGRFNERPHDSLNDLTPAEFKQVV